METIKRKKTFDCVKMKNDIQAKILAETQGMTTEELLDYFNTPAQNNPVGKHHDKRRVVPF